ncbi:hypothetical protein BLNAU_19956 [Blattamonas nauphoetae]|uniref:Uncharacterized protein n=1 Tax=Blattamonas nauphoetae TaxID=2049346 RepID=A0ABQ9X005_9EUKA|nr:hypothetical protein BLNAU_19956 [Blattamonas nauphoetae]
MQPEPQLVATGTITSVEVTHSEMPYKGSLVDIYRTRELLVQNSSFTHLQDYQTYTDRYATSKDHTFTHNIFKNINAGEFESGAALCWSGTSLNILQCQFLNLNAKKASGDGGALYATSGAVKIVETLFKECRARDGGAIYASSSKITVLRSQFDTCESTRDRFNGDFQGDGTGTRLDGGGGAMFLKLNANHHIVDCIFEKCTAPSFGGGILIWNWDMGLPSYFRLAFCMFVGTKVNATSTHNSGGHVMMVAHVEGKDGQTTTSFFKGKNSDGTKRMEGLTSDAKAGSSHVIRFGRSDSAGLAPAEFRERDYVVATSGNDNVNCGISGSECRTVTWAANLIKTGYTITVRAGTFTDAVNSENKVAVFSRTLSLKGQGKFESSSSGSKIQFTRPSFSAPIYVTTGAVTVKDITLELTAPAANGWNLVEVDGEGSATLKDAELLGSGAVQNGRLVSVTNGKLTVTNCDFKNINSNLDVGAAILANISTTSQVTIMSSSFSECKLGAASTNVGAGIFLFLQTDARNYNLKTLTFDGNTADRAADIFISADTLVVANEALTPAKFIAGWNDDATDNERYRCSSRSSAYVPQELGIPEYLTVQTLIYVDETKTDTAGCGSEATPCKSLGYAKNQKGDISGFTVMVVGTAILNGSVEVGGSSFRPKEGTGQAALVVSLPSSLTIASADTTTIARIDFKFQLSGQSSTALFSTSAGKFHLTSCSFCSTSPSVQAPAQALISISGSGSIETDGLSISDLSFSSSIVSIVSSSINLGNVSVSHCAFTGPLSTILLSIELAAATTATLNVGSITFDTLTAPTASDSSKLTLAVVKGTSSTEITSEATLFTASSHTFSSNTDISFSGTSSAAVTLLTLELGSAFTLSIFSSSIVFAPSTSVTENALADTASSSLELSSSTINIASLVGFYSTALYAVPANALSITLASLSSPVIGNSKMSTPFAVVSGGTMTLTNISLNGNLLTSNFAHSMQKQTTGSLILNTCAFNSITTSDEGAAIQATLGTDEKLSLTGVAFTSCSSTGASKKGGAISVALTTGTFTADASTSFAGCSAANGGAIAIDLRGRSDPGTFTLSGVTFGTPPNTATTKGSDIFVLTGTGGRTFLTVDRFGNTHPNKPSSGTFFGTADLNKWYFVDSDSVEGSILYLLYPYKGGILNVHSSSPANDLCGHALLPCSTLNDGHRLVHSTTASNADDACIVLLSDVSFSAEITSSSTVEWKSDSTRRTITSSTDVCVTVSGGSLTVSNLKLTVTSSPFSKSFFTLSGGSLSVKSSEFSTISSTGEGSAIKAVLAEDQTLSLTAVTFTSCATTGTTTNGGALHVTVSGGSFTATAPISFTDCTATGKGSKLSLSSASISSVVSPTKLTALKPTSLPTTKAATDVILNDFYGYESGTSEMSLLYFWFPHTSSATNTHIHKDGANAPNCGLLQLPCSTLEEGLKHPNAANKFVIDSSLNFNEALSISSPLTVTADATTEVNVGAQGKFTITSNTLSLSNLAFTGHASSSSSSFMTVSSGGSLSIADCSFASFSSSSNGAAIQATLAPSRTLSLTRVAFTSCHTTRADTNGGALHMTLEGGSFLIPSPSSFESCSAKGNGGAVFVDVTNQLGGSFSFRNGSFGEAETANTCEGKGKDVFIEGGDLSSIITKALFPQAYSASPANERLLDSIRLSSNHTDPVMSLLQYLFSPAVEGTIDDEISSADNGQCGHLEVRCKTLAQLNINSQTLSKTIVQTKLTIKQPFAPSRSLTITSVDQDTKASLVLVSTPSLKVQDQTHVLALSKLNIAMEMPAVITNSGTGYVVLDVGKLEVSESSFTSSMTMPVSLISVTGSGSLDVSGFNVENVVLTNAALIEATGSGHISIKTSIFKSVTRTLTDSANSTVLSTTVSSFSSFALNTVHIDSCETAIFLDMEGCLSTTPYSVKSVSFESTDANQLVVVGSNLFVFITDERWTGSFETLTSTPQVLFSRDSFWDLNVSLLVYLLGYDGDVHLNTEEGGSSPICGEETIPCGTVEMGISRVAAGGRCICDGAVSIGSGDVWIQKGVVVMGKSLSASIVFVGGQSLICSSDKTLPSPTIFIRTCTLDIPSQPAGQSGYIIIEEGSVEIENCVVSGHTIASPVVACESGQTVISNISLSINNLASPLLLIESQATLNLFTLSSAPSDLLIIDKAQNVLLSQLVLSGPAVSSSSITSNSENVCSWTGGCIHIVCSSATISSSSFASFGDGVISIVDSDVSLVECTFSANFVGLTAHPSLQHNILCSNSTVDVGASSRFDQKEASHEVSMWISNDDCSISAEDSFSPAFPFFVPTINTPTVISFVDKDTPASHDAKKVTLTGANFLDCGLSFAIVAEGEHSDATVTFNLSGPAPKGMSEFSQNDSRILFRFDPQIAMVNDGNYTLNVLIDEKLVKDMFLFTVKTAKKALLTTPQLLLTIVLPVSIFVIIVFIIILVVCLCRRKQKKKNEQDLEMSEKNNLLANQSEFFDSEPKTGEEGTELDEMPEGPRRAQFLIPQSLPVLLLENRRQGVKGIDKESVVCVLSDPISTPLAFADRRMSLFERIHGNGSPFDDRSLVPLAIGEADDNNGAKPVSLIRLGMRESIDIAIRVARTLFLLKRAGETKEPLTSESREVFPPFCISGLTSHSILYYPDRTLLIALPPSFVSQIASVLPVDGSNVVDRMVLPDDPDFERWYSPEKEKQAVLTEDESEKSVVFSLGLVLFEMLSELIPFQEVDAVSAHRKIKTGVIPNLSLIEPSEIDEFDDHTMHSGSKNGIQELLLAALSLDPTDRPSLEAFAHSLEGLSQTLVSQPQNTSEFVTS